MGVAQAGSPTAREDSHDHVGAPEHPIYAVLGVASGTSAAVVTHTLGRFFLATARVAEWPTQVLG